MRLLTIDQGNTFAKAVLWEDRTPVKFIRCVNLTIEDLLPIMGNGDLDGCVYCSVTGTDARLLESLRTMTGAEVMVLTSSCRLPFEIDYSTPATLGPDRLASVAGALSESQELPLLVIDTGTAITIDIVDAGGVFRGGTISPGMRMRFQILNQATASLPIVNADSSEEIGEFGKDTVSAIRDGVVNGIIGEILYAYKNACRLYGKCSVMMTGGDAPLMYQLLLKEGMVVKMIEDLTGVGMVEIFNYSHMA